MLDQDDRELDAMLLAVLANRFDNIVKEMTSTLLRMGHSTIISVAKDLSCTIVTADDQLLSAVDGITVHVFGSQEQASALRETVPNLKPGDAFLDNDPYLANTHAADHTILVPVFWGDEHVFTVCAKAHQADCGNSVPSTYHPLATDVYQEGALIFPMVQVQRDYESIDDVVRMCKRRIRVPDQWYGDFLAMIGAARAGERRIHEVIEKYGLPLIKKFVARWLDYSEEKAVAVISQMKSGTVQLSGGHDGFEGMPDGIPLTGELAIDADAGRISVDLTANIDNVPNGMNQSRTCATNNAVTGVFNALGPDVPVNSGAFRRIEVKLREGSVLWAKHPMSCSVATTNLADRVINMVTYGLSSLGRGVAPAEGGVGMGPAFGVIAGHDQRTDRPFVNSLIFGCNGGPAVQGQDGWLTYATPVGAGFTRRDSVELAEVRYPMVIHEMVVQTDSGGAGEFRGAPGIRSSYSTLCDEMTVGYMLDGGDRPARGVWGGHEGSKTYATVVRGSADQPESLLPRMGQLILTPGDRTITYNGGGGGYGRPRDREPARVLTDVLERLVSIDAAREVYGVCIQVGPSGRPEILEQETADLRVSLRQPEA